MYRILFHFFCFIHISSLFQVAQAQISNNPIFKTNDGFIGDFIPITVGDVGRYDSIMNRVSENIFQNYDSLRFVEESYSEFVYIDSTKEIISAVQLNTLKRESGAGPFSNKSTIINNSDAPVFRPAPSAPYFLSGTLFEKSKDYGYATLMHLASSGKIISYATSEMDLLYRLLSIKRGDLQPPVLYNSVCAPSTRVRESITYTEVKDTIYNQTDCYLLRKTTNSLFTFDEKDYKGRSESVIKKLKELTGNWSPLYETVILTTIVNKSDDAILKWSRDVECINNHEERRTFYMTTEYQKEGNHYYQTYYEYRYPRLFSLVDMKAGLNDKDMYSLIIRKFADAKIDKNREKELGISKMKTMRSDTPYEKYLKKESVVNQDMLNQWRDYWKQFWDKVREIKIV